MNVSRKYSGTVGLIGATLVMLFGWLVVLPAIAARPAMAEYLERMDEKGIDASAMFYTELEMMAELLDRIEGTR